MTNRLINIKKELTSEQGAVRADVEGLVGEELSARVYQPYGLSSNVEEETTSVLMEMNGDPNNVVTLPQGGTYLAPPGTVILHGPRNNGKITIDASGGINFSGSGNITTDMDIIISGTDIIIDGVSLKQFIQSHVHPGVKPGSGVTGAPLP